MPTIESASVSVHETAPLPDDVIFEYVAGAGNHERKLALATLFLTHPDQDFTPGLMRIGYDSMQDGRSPWPLSAQAANGYCVKSLLPAKVITSHTEPVHGGGPEVVSYRANPDHLEARAALTGLFSDWSLSHPLVSVQKIFGRTDTHGIGMPPKVRFQIYWELLTAPDGLSGGQLNHSIGSENYRNRRNLFTQLKLMEEQNVITYLSKHTDYNPTLQVVSGVVPDEEVASQLLPERRAVYTAIRSLDDGTAITVDDLVGKALEVDPSLDANKLRTALVRDRNDTKRTAALVPIEDLPINRSEFTKVIIKPELAGPIQELLDGIEEIRTGKNLQHYLDRLHEIALDPQSVRTLVEKAREFSSWSDALEGRAEAESEIRRIIVGEGEWTLKSIQVALKERHNRKLTQSAIRTIMSGLVERGQAKERSAAAQPYSKRKTKEYSAPESR